MDISLKNNFLDNFDDNSNTTEPPPATATVDSASAYCPNCFDKSISSFQINASESIKLCINPDCLSASGLASQITYDTNNNKQQQPKKFKYSSNIERLTAQELKVFFETDLSSVDLYQSLSRVFNNLVKPVTLLNETTNVSDATFQLNETSQILPEPSNDQLFDTSVFQIDPKLSLAATENDPLATANQTISFDSLQFADPTNDAPLTDMNFENELLQMLDDDDNLWQNTDLTNSEFLSGQNNLMLQDIQANQPVEQGSSVKALNLDQTDLLSELLGLDTTIPEQKESLYVTPIAENTLNSLTITDARTTSGSRIKITKTKKKKESMFDKIELVDGEIITKTDSNSSVKYDSIGENEDSSDQLLPWEVKSSGSKRKSTNSSCKHLEKMMARSKAVSSPQPKKPFEISGLIPSSVTKADLSSKKGGRFEGAGGLGTGEGTSFKKALSAADNFKEEVNKTTKISHLFNTNDLIKSSPFGGSRGVKDLVLNILRKKTNI